jgi:hypothetical protein
MIYRIINAFIEIKVKSRYSVLSFFKYARLMSKLTLKLIRDTFSIHSLAVNSDIPKEVFSAPIYFIAKTYDELSIVLPSHYCIGSDNVETDWQALEVVGPLEFSLTGILSNISSVLAGENISIFAVSTFDTDYILVKSNTINSAITALRLNHYQVLTKNENALK